MKPAAQQQQGTSESLAEIELNLLLSNEEPVSSGDNVEKELVSTEDGDWCVQRNTGDGGDGEKEEEEIKWQKGDSEKTQLL